MRAEGSARVPLADDEELDPPQPIVFDDDPAEAVDE
jgi:hypothetical protein